MGKVKITQEQADAIEKAWKMSGNKVFIIRMHDRDGSVLIDGREQLGDISTDTLIKALYIGYEVELEFEEGQWVALDDYASRPIIAKILEIDIEGDGRLRLDWSDHCYWDKERIRHATPSEIAEEKERRFWKKHGRDVWELREGDFLVNEDKIAWEVTSINPNEDYCSIDYTRFTYDEIKRGFLVMCFAENRLDVKTNE